jgi:hypothetical protein
MRYHSQNLFGSTPSTTLCRLPMGSKPEPPEPVKLDIEQSYTEVEELSWLAPVYDEDTGNLLHHALCPFPVLRPQVLFQYFSGGVSG